MPRRRGDEMRQVQVRKGYRSNGHRARLRPAWEPEAPLDPRDPDVARAKALQRRASQGRVTRG